MRLGVKSQLSVSLSVHIDGKGVLCAVLLAWLQQEDTG